MEFKPNLIPHLYTNGCICHILNLASLAASKYGVPEEIDKFMKDFRILVPKFQKYFGTSIHIIFKYASTRLLSRQEVVERIIEQWEPLNYYFTLTDFVAESKNERLKFPSLGLKNHLYKLTFLFLEYI